MDAADFPPILAKGLELGHQGLDIAKNWLLSPAAWSQFLILIAAYVLAWVIRKKLHLGFNTSLRQITAPHL
jgi:potassium efflux system protein